MGLGSFRFVSLAAAREKAWNYRKMVSQGIDPIEAKRGEREADRQERARLITFEAFAESHVERHKGAWKDLCYAQVWRSQLSNYAYPIIGSMWLQDIRTDKILQILEPIWYTKTPTARQLLNKIEQIFDDAIVQGKYLGQNPARWQKHLEESLPSPAEFYRAKHHPALLYPELPAFMAKLRKSDHIGSPALALVILIVVRIDEARGITWDEIDWNKKILTISAKRMKGRREGDDDHGVPLSDPALELLQRMKSVRVNDYVFPGENIEKPISKSSVRQALSQIRSGVTVHGFRRTFRNWAGSKTVRQDLVEMCLAHTVDAAKITGVDRSIREAYLDDDPELRRPIMQDWATFAMSEIQREEKPLPTSSGLSDSQPPLIPRPLNPPPPWLSSW